MNLNRKSKVVVTIHGIRTHGRWQKDITPYLAEHNLIPYHIDFGWFGAVQFLIPYYRNKQIQSVREQIDNLIIRTKVDRVSIIAHSFGTFIAMEVLSMDEGQLKYDRVVLAGSIVKNSFNWNETFSSKKKLALAVYNKRATDDWVVSLAKFLSSRWVKWLSRLDAGDSGRNAFIQSSPYLIDHCIKGGHSEALKPINFDQWSRFISYPYLTDELLKKIRPYLQQLRELVGSTLKQPKENIRVNLMVIIEGALRILPGATDNMNYVPEFAIKIEPGHGCAGTAYLTGNSYAVIRDGDSWPGGHLPDDELKKTHPSLKWVISIPIISKKRNNTVVAVLNIDGIDKVPTQLKNTSSKQCQTIIVMLSGLMKPFIDCMDAGFYGEKSF